MENLKKTSIKRKAYPVFFLSLLLMQHSVLFAQETTGESGFAQIKGYLFSSDSITSVMMILGVVIIVCLAIYLSFSGDDSKKSMAKK